MKNYCVDCKKEISLKAIRCKSCAKKGKLNPNFDGLFYGTINHQIGKNNSNYKHGETLKKHYCIDCGINEIDYTTWYYGQKRCQSCDTKKKIKEGTFAGFKKGKEHYAYVHGQGYAPYAKDFNETLKEQIRKRDNYICQNCDMTEEEHLIVYGRVLEVHHIDYNKQNCNKDNLITTCKVCNMRANFNRDYWKNFFENKLIIIQKEIIPNG
jgi:hypothetical protein